MATNDSGSGADDKVRIQVTLCGPLATDLARHAKELGQSQSWLAGWALRSALDDPAGFTKWMEKRLRNAAKHQEWNGSGKPASETRLQLRIERQTGERLELAAGALNQSALKLGGLMIAFTLEDSSTALWVLKTQFGKFLRRAFNANGEADAEGVDDEQTPERRELRSSDQQNGSAAA